MYMYIHVCTCAHHTYIHVHPYTQSSQLSSRRAEAALGGWDSNPQHTVFYRQVLYLSKRNWKDGWDTTKHMYMYMYIDGLLVLHPVDDGHQATETAEKRCTFSFWY